MEPSQEPPEGSRVGAFSLQRRKLWFWAGHVNCPRSNNEFHIRARSKNVLPLPSPPPSNLAHFHFTDVFRALPNSKMTDNEELPNCRLGTRMSQSTGPRLALCGQTIVLEGLQEPRRARSGLQSGRAFSALPPCLPASLARWFPICVKEG